MIQLIKTDFYKLLRLKSFWICSALCIVISVIGLYLLDMSRDMLLAMDTQGAMEGFDQSISAFTGSSQFVSSFSSDTLLFTAIITAIFVGSEFSNGTIKNTASKAFSRLQIYFSKVIVAIIASTVLILVKALITVCFASMMWGFGSAGESFVFQMLKIISVELLLNAGVISFFVMISFLIRKAGGTIAINIVVLQFSTILVSMIDAFLYHFYNIKITLSDYLMTSNIMQIANNEVTNDILLRGLIVAIVGIILTNALGIFSFYKRDIK